MTTSYSPDSVRHQNDYNSRPRWFWRGKSRPVARRCRSGRRTDSVAL